MATVSVAYTPYHLLMALSWEEQRRPADHHHVIVSDAAFPDGTAGHLARGGKRVTMVPGRLGLSRMARQLRTVRVLARLRRLAKASGGWDTVLVGSDLVPEANRLAAMRRGGPGLELLEDGIGVYLAGAMPTRGQRSRLAESAWSLLYGRGARQAGGVGQHPATSLIHAIRPELVTWKPASRLVLGPAATTLWTGLYDSLLGQLGDLRGDHTLVLLPGPGHPHEAKVQDAMLHEAAALGGRILVKAHPRSTIPVRQAGGAAVTVVPAAVPAEAVAQRFPDAVTHVVTTQSTPCYSVPAVSPAKVCVVDTPDRMQAGIVRRLNADAGIRVVAA